ncbi:MAG: glycosyltransferase family 39 protein [Acidobacteriota bacterium]
MTFSRSSLSSEPAKDLAALAAIASLFALGWLLVGSRADVPVIDDWVYAWSVEHLLKTRRLQVLEFSAIYPLAQIVWGAAFARVLGFSFVALRLSTVVLSVFGCWAVYGTLRELACRRTTSLLGAFALALDPVFFAFSFSFMTDVPFVDFSAIALYFYVSAVRRDETGRLWLGGMAALAAFLVRPIGIALPLSVIPVLLWRRDALSALRRAVVPVMVPLLTMAALQVVIPRTLGSLDWLAIRADQLRWVTSISLRTYGVWTIRVVLESVFPFAPLLLAPLARWRRAAIVGVVALLLIVPMQRARGEILTPLPNWQTWSMQDIGARAVIAGDAPASAWSARVMPVLRGLGLVTLASLLLLCGRGLLTRARWGRGEFVLVTQAFLLLGATHVLWLYNDRYYLVFAPILAVLAAAALDQNGRAKCVAAAVLIVWAAIGITGTRDLLAFNEACALAAKRLEARGVPPWEIDAGYPLNGWRLYAHSENLPPGADRRYDVPFVTSDRKAQYVIANYPPAGANVIEVVPLPRATWQATRELYVVKRP